MALSSSSAIRWPAPRAAAAHPSRCNADPVALVSPAAAVARSPAESRVNPGTSPATRPVPDVLAAVDLGSNSFHMVVARYSHGQLVVIDRLRDMVRLASGVEENGRIDKEVAARAISSLQKFGQRLRDMHARSVRVVGTNALRIARRKQ